MVERFLPIIGSNHFDEVAVAYLAVEFMAALPRSEDNYYVYRNEYNETQLIVPSAHFTALRQKIAHLQANKLVRALARFELFISLASDHFPNLPSHKVHPVHPSLFQLLRFNTRPRIAFELLAKYLTPCPRNDEKITSSLTPLRLSHDFTSHDSSHLAGRTHPPAKVLSI